MSDQAWPAPTPRDEMLARVVTRGRRIRMINRLLVGLAVGGVAAIGAVGVGLGYSGAVSMVGETETPVRAASGTSSYFGCPNLGAMGELRTGDRVYLTGRDDSGDWVQVRSPEDSGQRVWIRGEHVDPDEVVELDVVPCDDETRELERADGATTTTTTTTPESDPEPDETTTTSTTSTTTTSTTTTTAPPPPPPPPPSSTTTTTTTAPPAPAAPTFGAVQRSQATIREQFGGNCQNITATTSTISTSVSHPSGSVTVRFRSRIGDGAWGPWQTVATQTGFVQGQIGPYPAQTIPANSSAEVSWQFRATPTGGGPAATRTSTGNETVTLNWCSLF